MTRRQIFLGFIFLAFGLTIFISVINPLALEFTLFSASPWYDFNISVPLNACHTLSGEDTAVMVIYSEIGNQKGRKIVRETYANKSILNKLKVQSFFVIGRFEHNKNLSTWNQILKEQEEYEDIVIGDFVDTYRNLSYKGLTALRFVNSYCPQAKWLIKVDDDVMADVPKVMLLLRNEYKGNSRTIFGGSLPSSMPIVCPEKPLKWCIDKKSIYAIRRRYPPYVLGVGYVLTQDLILPMIQQAAYYPPFPIDDVYITGILRENIKNKHLINWSKRIIGDKNVKMTPGNHLFVHSRTENITSQWKSVINI